MKQELAQKRKHTDYRLCKRNRAIPEIILLNTKYDDNYYPRGAPISDDELSVDSYVGSPPSEYKGYESASPQPDTAPNISPYRVTPPNTSPILYTTQ